MSYRQFEHAHSFDEELVKDLAALKKEAAEPEAPPLVGSDGGLERIAEGHTALAAVRAAIAARNAEGPQLLKEHELKNSIRDKIAVRQGQLLTFVEKEAASRLDKEVAAGHASYSDVSPQIPKAMGHSEIAKRISRSEAQAPAHKSPAQLARKEKLDAAVFRNAHGAKHVTGEPLEKHLFPGMGPATAHGKVFAPETSGRFMRTIDKPLGGQRALVGSIAGVAHPNFGGRKEFEHAHKALTTAKPVDHTLNRAVLEHERGEYATMGRGVHHTHASHAGIEPHLRERQILAGHPEATAHVHKLRQLHPDDKLVHKLIHNAGGTADNPLPVGGKHQRAIERALEKNHHRLDPASRKRALGMQLTGVEQKTVPAHVTDAVNRLKGHLAETVNAPTPRGSFQGLKKILGEGRTISKYLKGIR